MVRPSSPSLPRPLAWSRLVPASHTAGEPSPALLVRARRSTTQTGAATSPVCASLDGPLAKPRAQYQDERNSGKRGSDSKNSGTLKATKGQELLKVLPVRPFVARGSAPSLPFFAPPPFEAFREASRKGAFLVPDRVTPRIHQSGASCPTPLVLTKRIGIQAEAPGGRFRREVAMMVVKVALWCRWRGC